MNVEAKSNFLRRWLTTISNPVSNVLQVLQDKFQTKFDECFCSIQYGTNCCDASTKEKNEARIECLGSGNTGETSSLENSEINKKSSEKRRWVDIHWY